MVARQVSVVMPTFNRRARLERALTALARQSVGADQLEVVVVDDGSSDGTSEWLSRQNFGFELRALRQDNAGPAFARNAGVRAASSRIVLFLDDDVEATPNLVAEHLRSRGANERVVVMGPLASLPAYPQPWVTWEQEKLEQQYRDMALGRFEPTFRQFWTGNASLDRDEVLEAGGFDARFLRAEDVELGFRLHLRGVSFRFNAQARGYHHAERSLASWCLAHESYGRLEVEIFGRRDERELIDLLGDNFGRLHPATRQLVSRCLQNQTTYDLTVRLFKGWLELEARTGKKLVASAVCSALANVLYWRASRLALGGERFDQVLTRANRARSEARA